MTTPIKLRVGDSISINGPWYEVWSIKSGVATLRRTDGAEVSRDAESFTRDCTNMTNGVRARIGYPVKWVPIPKGCVFYGDDKGYLPPIFGGYELDDSGRIRPLREKPAKFTEFCAKMERIGIKEDA